MAIVRINGEPYTTAAEDMRLAEFKKNFRKVLHREIMRAIRNRRGADMELDMEPIEELLDQAYYMGREDAS